MFPAPGAALLGAGFVSQAPHQPPRLRELVSHPRRHHRVATRHRQPRQCVGERPAVLRGVGDEMARLGVAGHALQAGADGVACLGEGRPGRAAQGLEDQIEARRIAGGSEPVPGSQEVRGRLEQLLLLVPEHPEGQIRVEFRIVATLACELPVLVVLDEAVIRVARERQGVEPQRVHHRHLQQPQPGVGGAQMGDVELDEVVAEQESRTVGEIVEVGQRSIEGAALLREYDRSVSVGAFTGECENAPGLRGDLEVDRHTTRQCSGSGACAQGSVPCPAAERSPSVVSSEVAPGRTRGAGSHDRPLRPHGPKPLRRPVVDSPRGSLLARIHRLQGTDRGGGGCTSRATHRDLASHPREPRVGIRGALRP